MQKSSHTCHGHKNNVVGIAASGAINQSHDSGVQMRLPSRDERRQSKLRTAELFAKEDSNLAFQEPMSSYWELEIYPALQEAQNALQSARARETRIKRKPQRQQAVRYAQDHLIRMCKRAYGFFQAWRSHATDDLEEAAHRRLSAAWVHARMGDIMRYRSLAQKRAARWVRIHYIAASQCRLRSDLGFSLLATVSVQEGDDAAKIIYLTRALIATSTKVVDRRILYGQRLKTSILSYLRAGAPASFLLPMLVLQSQAQKASARATGFQKFDNGSYAEMKRLPAYRLVPDPSPTGDRRRLESFHWTVVILHVLARAMGATPKFDLDQKMNVMSSQLVKRQLEAGVVPEDLQPMVVGLVEEICRLVGANGVEIALGENMVAGPQDQNN